jgi:hypothetical protein
MHPEPPKPEGPPELLIRAPSAAPTLPLAIGSNTKVLVQICSKDCHSTINTDNIRNVHVEEHMADQTSSGLYSKGVPFSLLSDPFCHVVHYVIILKRYVKIYTTNIDTSFLYAIMDSLLFRLVRICLT